jgi:hypothetical protein
VVALLLFLCEKRRRFVYLDLDQSFQSVNGYFSGWMGIDYADLFLQFDGEGFCQGECQSDFIRR